jgi:hypothetical protein
MLCLIVCSRRKSAGVRKSDDFPIQNQQPHCMGAYPTLVIPIEPRISSRDTYREMVCGFPQNRTPHANAAETYRKSGGSRWTYVRLTPSKQRLSRESQILPTPLH